MIYYAFRVEYKHLLDVLLRFEDLAENNKPNNKTLTRWMWDNFRYINDVEDIYFIGGEWIKEAFSDIPSENVNMDDYNPEETSQDLLDYIKRIKL